MRLVSLLLLVSLAGCAAIRPALTPPEKGGASWTELRSKHFILATDDDPRSARELLNDMETSRAVLRSALSTPAGSSDLPIRVVSFARWSDFLASIGNAPNTAAYFTSGSAIDVEPEPTIVMTSSEGLDDARLTWQHELTHRFLHARFDHLPTWLDEGMATFYSTAKVGNGRLVLGDPADVDFSERPYAWIANVGDDRLQVDVPVSLAPKLSDLIAADVTRFRELDDKGPAWKSSSAVVANYAASWRLVHLLTNAASPKLRADFAAYLDDLGRGRAATEAFHARFDADWTALDAAYQDYLLAPRLPRTARPLAVDASAAVIVERALSPLEVHLIWARIVADRTAAELDAAAAINPRSIDVALAKAKLAIAKEKFDDAERDVDRALDRGEDPRALYLKILLLRHRGWLVKTSDEAVERTVPPELVERLAHAARTADEIDAVAWSYAMRRRIDDGLTLERRAIAEDPLCTSCYGTLALLLAHHGERDAALAALDRAATLSGEGTNGRELASLRDLVRRIFAER